MKRLLSLLAAALLLLELPVAAQGQVLVVDASSGPGSQYMDIPPAVQAAGDGDVILVRPGAYTTFSVTGKALTIVGEDPFVTAIVVARSSVASLPAGKEVVLANLRLTAGLDLNACSGQVTVQNVHTGAIFTGGSEVSSLPGLNVEFCESVILRGAHVGGFEAPAILPGLDPGPIALRMEQSTVYAWDCILRGGKGFDGTAAPPVLPTAGSPGIVAVDSFLGGDELEVIGGQGGAGIDGASCIAGHEGGTALVAGGFLAPSQVELRASSLAGGIGGIGGIGCADGPDGELFSLESGQLTTAVGSDRNYDAPAVLREGDSVTVVVDGGHEAGGGIGFLLMASGGSALPLGFPTGTLVSSTPFQISVLGTLSSIGALSGTISVPLTVGDLGPGIQSVRVFTQGGALTLAGEAIVTEPVATVLLDSAF